MGMNILVTLDSKYISPLKVMLKSLFINNPEDTFTIYLMHSRLSDNQVAEIKEFVEAGGSRLENIYVEDEVFADAPVLFHYTKEMYFRLLAYKVLPENIDRILYLDPDILVINPIRKLYETEMGDNFYAAAYHDKITIKEVNKMRLYPYDIEAYYNSGVLLMNLTLLRLEADEKKIYDFIEENRMKLVMPDQDVLNALYAKRIKGLNEKLYNYDARYYSNYRITSNGVFDMDKIINNTVILHFCGKRKPWQEKYTGKFHSLYKHYEKLTKDAEKALTRLESDCR